MKKLIALMLGLVLILSMSTTAFAAGEQTGTTTITAEVPEPEPSYTIHIPANMILEYGNAEPQLIGEISVSDLVNVENSIICTVTSTTLASGTSVIPTKYYYENWEGNIKFLRDGGGHLENFVVYDYDLKMVVPWKLYVQASAEDWTAATPGTYTATLTFEFSL